MNHNTQSKSWTESRRFYLFSVAMLFATAVTPFARGQSCAFTYQGELNVTGNPANGNYDLKLRLYTDDGSPGHAGVEVGPELSFSSVAVNGGLLFLKLDFGCAPWTGCQRRWLEIDVRRGAAAYVTLSPRSEVSATPYALSAQTACSVAPGQVVKSLNGLRDDVTLSAGANVTLTTSGNDIKISATGGASGWGLNGNGGTTPGVDFLGTTDYRALELHVNGARAFRLEPQSDGADNVIGGFGGNFVSPSMTSGTIAGGGYLWATNRVSGHVGTIGGGANNWVSSFGSTISGGWNNSAAGYISCIGGGSENYVGGGNAVIAGGQGNWIQGDDYCTIGGGLQNSTGNTNGDTLDAAYATVGGGFFNTAAGYAATVAGGDSNFSSGFGSFVGGGSLNQATGDFSAMGGGQSNVCSALGGTVPGGVMNQVYGNYSFAAGQQALVTNDGAFVWADSQNAVFASTAQDQFSIRAQGGVRLNTDTKLVFGNTSQAMLKPDQGGSIELGDPTAAIFTSPYIDFHHSTAPGSGDYDVRIINDQNAALKIFRYNSVVPMAIFDASGLTINGSMCCASDRNRKENFQEVDANEVLAKVASLPLTRWNYKDDTASTHIGPMAQDFYAAFGVGPDDKHISSVDADGVALAAIQGLNKKLQEKEAVIESLQRRLDRLEAALSGNHEPGAH